MVLASATTDTLALVGVFFVLFPLLVHGLVVFAAAQAAGEKRENDAFREGGTSAE